jgi:SAM-dependent methyltransferase
LGGSYQSLPPLDYRDIRPEAAMSEQMQEQPADDCQQPRWFTLPRVSPTDWDQVRVSQLPPGTDFHGEATFVMRLRPATSFRLLDAGCGTGRVGIELARRRADVVGVDLDPDMLAVARSNAPTLDWRLGDLTTIRLGQTFDIVLLAGNVLVVVAAGTEAAIVANMAQHLVPGGLLIAGFRTDREYFTMADYDAATAAVGLSLIERWATWECASWTVHAPFAVSVHQRPYDEIELRQTEERSK